MIPEPRPSRALVIMAKAPRPGRVKTRLLTRYSPEQAEALYRCLLDDTVVLARGLPDVRLAIMCPAGEGDEIARWVEGDVAIVPQTGEGLASALTSVFREFIGAGYRRVVAFNSDSPHLPLPVLERAFSELDAHDVVVGPTVDGGYYLFGAKAVHTGLFSSHPLGTANALGALLDRLRQFSLTAAMLPTWYDVDVADDLARLAAELRADRSRAPRTAALLATWALADLAR